MFGSSPSGPARTSLHVNVFTAGQVHDVPGAGGAQLSARGPSPSVLDGFLAIMNTHRRADRARAPMEATAGMKNLS